MHYILTQFGKYGPALLIVCTLYLLKHTNKLFFYYIVGIILNSILNLILKGIIQEPRPIMDSRVATLAKTHAKQYFFKYGIPFDIFGMPSGHAQTAAFSAVYMYLAVKKVKWVYFYMFIIGIICWQRVESLYHSISQIVVGLLFGGMFANVVHHLARNNIRGLIRAKPDDNGPLLT